MYKIFLLVSIVFVLYGCSSQKEAVVEEKIITGKIERVMFSNTDFSWFERNYKNYSLPDSSKNALKNLLKNEYSCKIFMGFWCSDSRRDVPKFYKIADSTGFNNFEIIGLDHKKISPEGTEKNYKIEKVPTFIFFKSGIEIGRIIENPSKSIHEDVIDILKKAS
jgi:thiol-disulfide isomerase/thioredoxin